MTFWHKIKIPIILFLVFLGIFLFARAQQVTDSRFSVLLSHALYNDFSNNVKPYMENHNNAQTYLEDAQLVRQNINQKNEKWVMRYSQVPSWLIMPMVFILDQIGLSVVDEKNKLWDIKNEITQQVIIASILSALYGAILFTIARLWLATKFAIIITVVLVLGSGVASTLSRAVWTDTFGCLFTILAIHHLALVHKKNSTLRPIYAIFLVSLAVFCKPLYIFSAITIVLWLIKLEPKKLLPSIVFASIGAIVYITYSFIINKSFIAVYNFGDFTFPTWEYFWGIIISPSRGILIFWPWIFFVVCALVLIYKKIDLAEKNIIKLATLPIIFLIILLSTYNLWWAGLAYGPRLQTPMLPWLSLITIITMANFINVIPQKGAKETIIYTPNSKQSWVIFLGVVTAIWSLFINIYGINQTKAFYAWHLNITFDPRIHKNTDEAILERMWNWRDPIFLAGIVDKQRYEKIPPEFLKKSKPSP